MNIYRVEYYYLATGMEGNADERSYGTVNANTEEEAADKIAKQEYPIDKMYGPNDSWSTRDFFKGCLRVTKV